MANYADFDLMCSLSSCDPQSSSLWIAVVFPCIVLAVSLFSTGFVFIAKVHIKEEKKSNPVKEREL